MTRLIKSLNDSSSVFCSNVVDMSNQLGRGTLDHLGVREIINCIEDFRQETT